MRGDRRGLDDLVQGLRRVPEDQQGGRAREHVLPIAHQHGVDLPVPEGALRRTLVRDP